MREIKFRAWHLRLKKMFAVYSVDWKHGLVFCEGSDGNTHTFGFIDVELKQFTEIHDDHETEEGFGEIYDGAVIEYHHEGQIIVCSVQYEGGRILLAANEFDDGYLWINDLIENDDSLWWLPESKVIGHIYEQLDSLRDGEKIAESD
ncbi:hypothetical protein SD71_15970 [Cohnella kolymensis]|uniref:YopX protein domain-containing protein n=1 Tax=Cohnella kolymensis TaxID=1590652 RepID=A0ABR5A235_9BACL|nr:YopX family protein [Cohnella kolymensis]KIL35132.1 hypothetical protein SD71_15970 [Cohnella kolymensis]